jgi:hypothetical protein
MNESVFIWAVVAALNSILMWTFRNILLVQFGEVSRYPVGPGFLTQIKVCPLKIRPKGYSETSASNYGSTLPNGPEKRR